MGDTTGTHAASTHNASVAGHSSAHVGCTFDPPLHSSPTGAQAASGQELTGSPTPLLLGSTALLIGLGQHRHSHSLSSPAL